jgi:hypothetical protein
VVRISGRCPCSILPSRLPLFILDLPLSIPLFPLSALDSYPLDHFLSVVFALAVRCQVQVTTLFKFPFGRCGLILAGCRGLVAGRFSFRSLIPHIHIRQSNYCAWAPRADYKSTTHLASGLDKDRLCVPTFPVCFPYVLFSFFFLVNLSLLINEERAAPRVALCLIHPLVPSHTRTPSLPSDSNDHGPVLSFSTFLPNSFGGPPFGAALQLRGLGGSW